MQATADSADALAVARGTRHANTALDAGWPVAYLLVTLSAWQRPRRHALRPAGLTDLVTPAVFALVSVAILFVAAVTFRQLRDLAVFHHQARTDELTALANRRRFTEARTTALARPGAPELAVLLIDLTEPFLLSGVRVHVGASIGVAAGAGPSTDAAELLRRADVAMYRAKTDRRAAHEYAETLDESSRDRLRLVDELRRGIEESQLVVHHQTEVAVSPVA